MIVAGGGSGRCAELCNAARIQREMHVEWEILIRLAAALVLSGVLGWEREAAGKPAGLRTHMLVGAGAALFVGIGELLVIEFQSYGDLQRFDPTRVLEAVVAGVSFLGAGTILFTRHGRTIEGLTTAASLWTTSAVGMCVGLGRYRLAVGATVLLFLVLHSLIWLERRAQARREAKRGGDANGVSQAELSTPSGKGPAGVS